MFVLRFLLVVIFLGFGTGCDSSCDDLTTTLCTGPKGKADPDCKVLLEEERRDALTAETCASILKSMRE